MRKSYFVFLWIIVGVINSVQAQNIADYQLNASSGSFTALTSATVISLSEGDDGTKDDLPIGFTFSYGGVDYDEFGVSSNGFMALGLNSSGGTNLFSYATNDLSDGASGDRPIIAPLWDDLDMSSGSMSYKTEGSTGNQILTVEWLNVEWDYEADNVVISFQVKLYEADGKIEFIYRQEANAPSNGSASIGLTDTNTGSGSFLSLSDATTSPSTSSTTETSTISTRPATGQIYAFTKPAAAPEIELVDVNNNIINGGGSYDFDNTSSLTRTFTIKNKGQQTLTLGTTSISNSKFTITSAFPSSIASGASATFSLQYSSTELTSSESGTLSFSTNDSDESPFVLNLTAQTIPVMALADNSLTLSNAASLALGISYGLNTVTKTITIENNGSFALNLSNMSITGAGFSISGNAPSSVAVGTSETITLQYDFNENTDGTLSFNTNDPSKGTINFPLQGMLLPRFTATTGTFTALTSATNANISSDDDYVDNLNIGFNFNYFGRDYDKFAVSSNGFLILGNGSTNLFSSYTSNNLFDGAGGTRPVIAPLWDDLNMASGTVSYKTEGTSGDRVLTVEWLNAKWDYDASSAVISFQVKMYEANGKVEFIYQQETGTLSSPSASIGLTNAYVGTTSFLSLSDATGSPTASNTNETSNIDTKPATGQVYSFTPTLAPTITGFTPAQAVVGTSVTITGTNFSTTSGLNTVKFNGVTATVTSATTTELQTTVPAGATTGKITVEVNNLTATSSTDFTVTLSANAPSITSFTPAQAIIGTSVTITGTNFSATAANNTVKFNGVTATVTSATATQIQTTVPVGATTGKITVEVNGETAISSTDFTVTTSSVTALPQNLNEAKLILFPNPMRDVLRMEVKGKTNGTQVTIVILNNQGNEVLSTSKSLLNGQLELPIQELAAGQYLIKIHIGDEVILRRIVKL